MQREIWYRDAPALDALIYRGQHPTAIMEVPGHCAAYSAQSAQEAWLRRKRALGRSREHLSHMLQHGSRGICQRTPEWYEARKYLITASDAAQAVGEGKFGSQQDFFMKKLDLVQVNYDIPPLRWGIKYEPVAARLYEHLFKVRVNEFGLLIHPNHKFIGASPDGINDFGIMLEIKCPYRRRIDGTVPAQYYMQMQLQLDVCGLDECDYMECEIEEICDDDEFLRISSQPGTFTGAVVSDASGNYSYKYTFGNEEYATASDLIDWCNEKHTSHSLWNVHCYQIQRVTRDVEFVEKTIVRLSEVYDRLQHYAAHPEELLGVVPAPSPKPKKPTQCLFVDSDNE